MFLGEGSNIVSKAFDFYHPSKGHSCAEFGHGASLRTGLRWVEAVEILSNPLLSFRRFFRPGTGEPDAGTFPLQLDCISLGPIGVQFFTFFHVVRILVRHVRILSLDWAVDPRKTLSLYWRRLSLDPAEIWTRTSPRRQMCRRTHCPSALSNGSWGVMWDKEGV